MTDDNDNSRQSSSPGASAPGGRVPLTLKPRTGGAISAGMVKQSFSHGRTKTVVVETKRRRVEPVGGAPSAVPADRRPAFDVRGPVPPRPAPAAGFAPPGGLSEEERRARQRVI